MTSTNGGLGMAILNPLEETSATIESFSSVLPASNDAPLLIAASTLNNRTGRKISGGHFKEVPHPIELPEQQSCFNGKIDRPRLSNIALSKENIETLASSYDECNTTVRSTAVGAWDFHANIGKNISSTKIIDTSPNNHNGFIINMPNRGMTGYNWTADPFHHNLIAMQHLAKVLGIGFHGVDYPLCGELNKESTKLPTDDSNKPTPPARTYAPPPLFPRSGSVRSSGGGSASSRAPSPAPSDVSPGHTVGG